MGLGWQLAAALLSCALIFLELLLAFCLWLCRAFLWVVLFTAMAWSLIATIAVLAGYPAWSGLATMLAASFVAFMLLSLTVWLRAVMHANVQYAVRRLNGVPPDEPF